MELGSKMTDLRSAEALIGEMQTKQGLGCAACRAELCSHQVLMNMAMGFRDKPRCLPCLAAALGRSVGEFRDSLIAYLQHRECYQSALAWADRNEGARTDGPRACLELADKEHTPARFPEAASATAKSDALLTTTEWDAGDMGCGDLVLELRLRLDPMRPGEIIKLCARDPGAPEDLPAWCRLTGHLLLRAEHPTYWIERKK
jgi:tRNA 2-thiouridine synthesizing protein A